VLEPLKRPEGEGLLLVDKPVGPSSARVVSIVKRACGVRRVGHGGTLDPFASGLLPVLMGRRFTREAGSLLGGDKEYVLTLRLGSETDTLDFTGQVISRGEGPLPSGHDVSAVLGRFEGVIDQKAPAYSALKLDGRPLYWYARRGIKVAAPTRKVEIHQIVMEEFLSPDVKLRVVCGKGTYMRALGRDIGRALGCLGHLTALRRIRVGPYSVDQALPLWRISAVKGGG